MLDLFIFILVFLGHLLLCLELQLDYLDALFFVLPLTLKSIYLLFKFNLFFMKLDEQLSRVLQFLLEESKVIDESVSCLSQYLLIPLDVVFVHPLA